MTNADDAAALVTKFCALWSRPDLDEIVGYFTEDAIYHNIPMPPAQGREAIREFIAGFMAAFDGSTSPCTVRLRTVPPKTAP